MIFKIVKNFFTVICAVLVVWMVVSIPLSVAASGSQEPCETRKGLVILVRFPDIPPRINDMFVMNRFAKLNYYVREMSYGKVCVDVDITGWNKLPDPIESYAISPANLLVDRSKVTKLIQDAIDAADESHDFSKYSFVVLFLGAKFREYGMVGLCGYPGMLGWKQQIVFKSKRGQVVPGGVAIFTFQAHLGTLFHDIAHIWGGVENGKRKVPCLYDHDIQVRHPTRDDNFAEALINMGYWDPLSCHFYQRNLPPPGLSSWTKLRLGWIPPSKIFTADPGKTSEVMLGPLEDAAAGTLVVRIPLSPSTYYLVENRQPIGKFDSHLPGKGILIMYANDDVAECRQGKAPVKLMNADPQKPNLLGAAYDLPEHGVFTDETNNIEIRLLEKIGNTYKIRIKNLK